MQKSETIGKLAAALCAAQGQMTFAKKDSDNPFFKSKYADLGAVIEAVKGPLLANGLVWTQIAAESDRGIGCTTMLMHTSGEWIAGTMMLPAIKQDPQACGSAFSYARRYSLLAICGIAQDDDDGEAARKAAEAAKKPQAPTKATGPTVIDDIRKACSKEMDRLKVTTETDKTKASNAKQAFVLRLVRKEPTTHTEWMALLEKLRTMSPADVDELSQ